MFWFSYLLYFALGALLGCLAGLLGIGGGLIVVPTLNWLFQINTHTASFHMHMAIATSLATMVVTSLVVSFFQSRKRAVQWPIVGKLAIGMVAGALLGPFVSDLLSTRSLEVIFGAVEIAIAITLYLKGRKTKQNSSQGHFPQTYIFIVIGFVAAFIGSMLGLGGGIILVPALILLGLRSQHAVATSAASLFITAFIGSISQIANSWDIYIASSIGYIYIPAAIGIALGSLLFAPLGVKLSHKLPEEYLNKIFVFVLLALGVAMIV